MTNNFFHTIENEILPFVDKPARYIGGEYNSIVKSTPNDPSLTRIALIYPDLYEIGMSNIGMRILYHLVNKHPDFACERAFAPWPDMEEMLRRYDLPLYSLETKTSLKEFDVLGFTFQYELVYTNFLNMLNLSGIEFRSEDRTEDDPIIIAGGPATANIEPIADFLDAVCIGDGESRIIAMMETIRKGRAEKLARAFILENLADIQGVYVPSLYRPVLTERFAVPTGRVVERYIEPSLNDIDYPTCQLIPSLKAIQDRAVVEVARGCTRGCRFCQAGMTYRPVRERNINTILDIARQTIQQTGYREFSMISLSISDYSQLPTLIKSLDEQFSEHGVSFSLPSLRLDSFTLDLAKSVRQIRKSGLTFAVEGGTQHIRNAINKGINEDELMEVIGIASSLEWRAVKLYFMIGLPGVRGVPEDEDEVQGIIDLVRRIHIQYKSMSITVSIAVFIPKPWTPYQWVKQLSPDEALKRFYYLKDTFRSNRKISVKYHDPYVSYLEGVFSRGDRRLADVLEIAYKKGARFDGWDEFFDIKMWRECFKEANIDPENYLDAMPDDTTFPWEIIDNKTNRAFLEEERAKTITAEATPDCREKCYACDSCDFKTIKPIFAVKPDEIDIDKNFLNNVKIERSNEVLYMRFLCDKKDAMKYRNQIDTEETLSRGLVRANIPFKYTAGYNKHIRIEMGWALPIGFESECEICQVELNSHISSEDFITAMNQNIPAGTKIHSAVVYGGGHKLNRSAKSQYVEFSFEQTETQETILARYEANKNYEKITPKKTKIIELPKYIENIKFENNRVRILYFQTDGGARMQDIISAMTGKDVRAAVCLSPMVHRRFVRRDEVDVDVLMA